MDVFDIRLESTGSMYLYGKNTMAVFRNLLAHPIQLQGDRRVAPAEIIFPAKMNGTTTEWNVLYKLR